MSYLFHLMENKYAHCVRKDNRLCYVDSLFRVTRPHPLQAAASKIIMIELVSYKMSLFATDPKTTPIPPHDALQGKVHEYKLDSLTGAFSIQLLWQECFSYPGQSYRSSCSSPHKLQPIASHSHAMKYK